jgi:hypothetical protein
MRRWLPRIVLTAIALTIAIQFVPIDRRNPPVIVSQTIYATTSVPPNIRAIVDRSCKDCHSNETRWPWYSYVAPASWLVSNDVHEARRKMNFSEWGTYSQNKKAHELEEICNELLDGSMPDSKYTFIHRTARLTQPDREAVCQWIDTPQH